MRKHGNRRAGRHQACALSGVAQPCCSVMNHLADGVLVFLADGRCCYLNPAARRLLGIKVPPSRFRPPPAWRERMERVLADGKTLTCEEYLTGRGGLRVVESSWTPWPGPRGRVVGVSCLYRDVTRRQRLNAERRLLAQRLLEVQEQERKNISKFLHDHMGPLLIMARMDLDRVRDGLKPRQAQAVDRALAHMDEALRGIRHKALAVRPPLLDDLEVRDALEFLVEEFTRNHRIPVTLDAIPRIPTLSPTVKTCLFRVLQEALQNVAVHARARAVTLRVSARGRELAMHLRDNGVGFDPRAVAGRQMGLIGMREIVESLGGVLKIRSKPGGGTWVNVVVPMDEEPREVDRDQAHAGG